MYFFNLFSGFAKLSEKDSDEFMKLLLLSEHIYLDAFW